MIAVIDAASNVRHACFNALTGFGHSVLVPQSPETYINPGALYSTNLLMLGSPRVKRTRSEPLLWARAVRPHLRTVLIGLVETQVKYLSEMFEAEWASSPQGGI